MGITHRFGSDLFYPTYFSSFQRNEFDSSDNSYSLRFYYVPILRKSPFCFSVKYKIRITERN